MLTECIGPRDRLLSVFDAVARYRDRSGSHRGCGSLAAATELPAAHPGQRWPVADTTFLVERLRELAQAAGAPRPAAPASDLVLLHDGALAGLARNTTTPGSVGDDPLGRARATARLLLDSRLADQ